MNEREQWLAERRKFCTASDVGALLGESKHKTRAQLVMEKIGLADDFAGNEHTDLALALEGPVLDIAAKRYGWCVQKNGLALAVDRECPRLACTLDASMKTPWGVGVVQVKWSTCQSKEDCKPFTAKGAPSTAAYLNGPPIHYLLQVQAEIACVGAVGGVLLVMHTANGGMKLRPYYVARHNGVIARIRSEVTKFWNEIEEGMK